jgi:anti-sigma factor RsiW
MTARGASTTSCATAADFGKRRLDDILKEPVPLALVRSIKSVQPPKAPVAPRLSRQSLKLKPTGPQALAAAIILFVAGCGIGYLVSDSRHETLATQACRRGRRHGCQRMAGDILANQRLLARQPRHIVEVPASQAEEISNWLTTSVGVAFRVPDLSTDGWTFQGARVVLTGGRPTGQLIYTSADGDLATIAFRKDNQPDGHRGFQGNDPRRDRPGRLAQCRHELRAGRPLLGSLAQPTCHAIATAI